VFYNYSAVSRTVIFFSARYACFEMLTLSERQDRHVTFPLAYVALGWPRRLCDVQIAAFDNSFTARALHCCDFVGML